MGDRLWHAVRLTTVVCGALLLGWLALSPRRRASPGDRPPPAPTTSVLPRPLPTGGASEWRSTAALDTPAGPVFEDAVKRVDFGPEQVTFSLGGPAAQTPPPTLALATHRIAVGQTPIYQRGDAVAQAPVRSGRTVRYARPAGIVERYDVDTRRVEQSFDLPARPGEGDLLVEVALGGSLQPRPHETRRVAGIEPALLHERNRVIDFVDAAGRVVAALGRAWAWDAAGRIAPVDVQLADGGYRLRLDGAWLASASYPVTVDPPVEIVNSGSADAPQPAGATTPGHGGTALAYNPATNTYLAVIEYRNGTDMDIEWAPLNPDGTFAGPIRTADTDESGGNQPDDVWPDVDYSVTSGNFLIVWAEERSADDRILTKIKGIRVDAAGATVGATLTIRDTEADTPAIANDDVGVISNGTTGGPVQGPRVSWNSANNRFLVAWRDGENGGDVAGVATPPNRTHGIRARLVEAATGTLGAGFVIEAMGPTSNVTSLDVAWNPNVETATGGRYMLAFSRTLGTGGPPPTTWSEDLFLNSMTASCDTDGSQANSSSAGVGNVVNFTSTASATNLLDAPPGTHASIAADTNPLHPIWMAAWRDQRAAAAGGASIHAIIATAALDTAAAGAADTTPPRLLVGDTTVADTAPPDIDPSVAWDSLRDDFLVVWHNDDGTASDAMGRRMDFNGDFVSDVFTISSLTSGNVRSIRPSAAFNTTAQTVGNPNGNKFLVVFIGGDDTDIVSDDDDTFSALVAPPVAPSGFGHSGNSTTSIAWTWTDNSTDELGFRVKDGQIEMTSGAPVTGQGGTGTATELGLSENTRYVRTVAAFNEFGESEASAAVGAYTSLTDPTTNSFTVTQPAAPACRTEAAIDPATPANGCATSDGVAHVPALGRPKGIAAGVIGAGARIFLAVADVPWIYAIDPTTDQIVARYDSRMPGAPPSNMANGMAFDTAGGVNKIFLVGGGAPGFLQAIDADSGAVLPGGQALCAGSGPFGVSAASAADLVFIAGFSSNSAHIYNTNTLAGTHICSLTRTAVGCPVDPAVCDDSDGNPPPAGDTVQTREGEEPSLAAATSTRGFGTYHNHGALGGAGAFTGTAVTGWSTTGGGAFGVAALEGRGRLYVGHRNANTISVFDITGNGFTPLTAAQITLPNQPVPESYALAAEEGSNRLFVIGNGNNLYVYDVSTDTAALERTIFVDQIQNAPTNDGGQYMTTFNGKVYIPSFQASRYAVVNSTAVCSGAGVRIERATGTTGAFAPITYPAGLDPDGDGYIESFAAVTDATLTPGTNYCYRILYRNGDGDPTVASQSTCVLTCPDDLIIQACGAGCGACAAGVAGPDAAVCALPAGTEGGTYIQQITATGGVQPHTWSVTASAPSFPFNLDPATGIISGNPSAGTYTFTLVVTDSQVTTDTDERSFSVTINPPDPNAPPEINDLPLPANGQVGQAYSHTFTAFNGQPPYTWSLAGGTSLPAGLTLVPETGQVQGTPTCVGAATFCVQATSANGLSDTTPTGTCGAGESFSITTDPSPVTITTSGLPGGSVNAPYSQAIDASGGVGPFTWTVDPPGAGENGLPPGLSLGTGSGASTLLSGRPTTAGTFTFTVRIADNGQFDCFGAAVAVADTQQFSVSIAPEGAQALAITTTAVPGATINRPYSAQVSATGGLTPYTWSIIAGTLADGLSLDPATGAITGTPTVSGTFQITVQVVDSGSPQQTATRNLTLSVEVGPSITTTSPLPGAVQNRGYSATFAGSGGVTPYTWAIVGGTQTGTTWTGGGVPAGLQLSETSGVLSGTPTVAGNFTFTIQLTDANGAAASVLYSLSVSPDPGATLTVLTTQLPSGQVGTPYSAQLLASGGTGPYAWTVLSGALPVWATLSPATGAITGTPTVAGTSTVQFRVTDSAAPTPATADSVVMSVIIVDALTITTVSPLPGGGLNALYSTTLAASGGTPGYTWAVTVGALPNGLSLNAATGTISGQPATVGTSVFTVEVADTRGLTATRQFSLTIATSVTLPPPPAAPRTEREAGFCFFSAAPGLYAPAALALCALAIGAASRRKRR